MNDRTPSTVAMPTPEDAPCLGPNPASVSAANPTLNPAGRHATTPNPTPNPAGRRAAGGHGWAQAEVPDAVNAEVQGAGSCDTPAPDAIDGGHTRPTPSSSQIEGLLLGLAAGDAAGWPAARHRAARMPEWTRRLTRELDTFAEQNATTTLPVPIALNQPPEPLRLGPSDDAEWAAFTAVSILAGTKDVRAELDHNWQNLAAQIAAAAARAPEVESAVIPLRARISVRAGLGNLANGLRPPATGHDNPHYFDDAACVRGCVLALVHAGNPQAAADLAEFDAR
ncbi:ADP-ribosylglycohydrolase family protein, partial [Streptomyces sp. T-3]|nr:ADP-ribosylglycohydrolase family protein [Streptomyces sp. T-3]